MTEAIEEHVERDIGPIDGVFHELVSPHVHLDILSVRARPVRLLKTLGRLPHEYDTWLGTGHTVPNGDPPEPYAPGTELCGALIAPPLLWPDDNDVLETDDGPLQFYGVIPVHADEMKLKLDKGVEALYTPFDAAGVTEAVDPDRPSLVGRRKRFGLF